MATALAILIAPIWAVLDTNNSIQRSADSALKLCRKAAQLTLERGNFDRYPQELADCDRHFGEYHFVGWEFWWQAFAATAAAAFVLYLLIWLTVATIKWVWRGRRLAQ